MWGQYHLPEVANEVHHVEQVGRRLAAEELLDRAVGPCLTIRFDGSIEFCAAPKIPRRVCRQINEVGSPVAYDSAGREQFAAEDFVVGEDKPIVPFAADQPAHFGEPEGPHDGIYMTSVVVGDEPSEVAAPVGEVEDVVAAAAVDGS